MFYIFKCRLSINLVFKIIIYILNDKYDTIINCIAYTNTIDNNREKHWDINYKSRVFIGLEQDCSYLFDLYTNHGIVFDAAVLINFDLNSVNTQKDIKDHTKIYRTEKGGVYKQNTWVPKKYE